MKLGQNGCLGTTLDVSFLDYIFPKQSLVFRAQVKEAFENIVRKGENAGNRHFPLFSQCFLPFPKEISIFWIHLFCHLQMLSIWKSLKFVLW